MLADVGGVNEATALTREDEALKAEDVYTN